MFDLTWFCSHMFSTSGEHPLLPVFSLLSFAWVGYGREVGGGGGMPAAVQVWALASWVENWLPVVLAGYSSQSQGGTCSRYVGTPHWFSLA